MAPRPATTINPDCSTGAPGSSVDANSALTDYVYDDLLDRLTKVIRGNTETTEYVYRDSERKVIIKRDLLAVGDRMLQTETLYDGLGRVVQTAEYDGEGSRVAVKTKYDPLGRVWQSSNPANEGTSDLWTTTLYDDLGNAKSVTAPDGSVDQTLVVGSETTATDPAGWKRKTTVDSIGRIRQVVEDLT